MGVAEDDTNGRACIPIACVTEEFCVAVQAPARLGRWALERVGVQDL